MYIDRWVINVYLLQVSPALVAFLDLLLGSTAEAVEKALLIVSGAVLLIALFCMNVPR